MDNNNYIWEHPEVLRMLIEGKANHKSWDFNKFNVYIVSDNLIPFDHMIMNSDGLFLNNEMLNKLLNEVKIKYDRDQKINDILE